jgi:hypothetical protein
VLAATLKATGPFPVPFAPEVMAIHDSLLVAVHAQPALAVTATVPLVAPAPTF